MQYKTGDHLGVFAENGKDVTKRVAKALKLDVDEVFRLGEAERCSCVARRAVRDAHDGRRSRLRGTRTF